MKGHHALFCSYIYIKKKLENVGGYLPRLPGPPNGSLHRNVSQLWLLFRQHKFTLLNQAHLRFDHGIVVLSTLTPCRRPCWSRRGLLYVGLPPPAVLGAILYLNARRQAERHVYRILYFNIRRNFNLTATATTTKSLGIIWYMMFYCA
jgi:hypothetical protein